MRIGELSKRTGVSIRMLRYYEGEGLLKPARTNAGYRDYGSDDEETVPQVKALGAAGMTLPVIRDFLPCIMRDRGEFEPCYELRAKVRQQIESVDERITNLSKSRMLLETILEKMNLPAP